MFGMINHNVSYIKMAIENAIAIFMIIQYNYS